MGNSDFQFPAGFRFRPSDEELIVHYLENRVNSRPLPASVIAEIDLYKDKALFGEDEWYFFTPRERKYPKGARLNRVAASGYWKATRTDKLIVNSCGSRQIGVKKALVFYTGPPPKRVKTEWIMNEYRLLHPSTSSRFKGSMRLDDWVLCRVRQKGNVSKNTYEDGDSCSMELPSYSPKMEEEVQLTSAEYNADMIMDNPFKDCQILPLILKGALPPIETISSISFGGSQKGNHLTSVYGDASNNLKSSTTVSSLDSYFRKFSEENEYESFLSNEKEIKDLQPSKTLANYDMNCYSQNHSQYDNFNPKPSEPITVFQELIEITLHREVLTVMNNFPTRQKRSGHRLYSIRCR